MPRQTHQRKPNGHAGLNGRPNGHGPASVERGGIPMPASAGRHGDFAASDDASGTPVASAPALTAAAGTTRDTYAAAAPPPPNGHVHHAAENPKDAAKKEKEIPGGEFPLPASPGEFVEEIHRRIDLFEVWLGLLREEDDKIRQRAVEKLTEMRYKGAAALAEEPQQFIFDMPRPKRD